MRTYGGQVSTLRRHLMNCPGLAGLIVASVLMLRVLIPSGFMPALDHGRIVVAICSGDGPERTISLAVADQGDERGSDNAPQDGSDGSCPFALLGATPLVPGSTAPHFAEVIRTGRPPVMATVTAVPGRGLAAPPPPSHAPPAVHA